MDVLEKVARSCMVSEANDVVNLSDDKSIDVEEEVKVVGESSRSLPLCKRLNILSPHHCPLKNRMKDKTVWYVDLLLPGPPPSRNDDEMKLQASKRLTNL